MRFTPGERDLIARFCSDNLEGLREAKEGIIDDKGITTADELLECMALVEEERELTENILRKVEEDDDAGRAAGDASPVPTL